MITPDYKLHNTRKKGNKRVSFVIAVAKKKLVVIDISESTYLTVKNNNRKLSKKIFLHDWDTKNGSFLNIV